MADIDFSLLDVPRSVPIDDPEAYLRAAIAWHFGEETGSAFWLRAAKTLDFDPLTDVTTFTDLRLFPNLLTELRNVPVEDLIPRGYGSPPPVPQVFESGGTTGAPKRTAQLPDWVAQVTEWQTEDFATGGFVRGQGFLCLMPSGPHGVSYFSRRVSERLGAAFHAIDIDPRWVKKIGARNAVAEVAAYLDHVLEQATHVLQTQNVANLHATPPMLEAIARNDDLVDLVNAKIRYLLLSGAHVDADTLDLLDGLLARRVPIDALGLQGHLTAFSNPVDQRKLRAFLEDVRARGLAVLITELDVDDSGGPSDIAARDAAVADEARRFLDVVLDSPATAAVLTWNLSDRYVDPPDEWRLKLTGFRYRKTPYDARMRPKPLWTALARAFAGRRAFAPI